MNIFEYENFELRVTQEAFLIKPIRDLFNADRTKTKDKFMSQMAILYFYIDPRSSYSYITDDTTRLETILLEEGLPKDFKVEPKLALAMETYRKHVMTTSSLLIQDTKLAIDNYGICLIADVILLIVYKGFPLSSVAFKSIVRKNSLNLSIASLVS